MTQVIFNPAPVFTDTIRLESVKGLAVLVVNETECLQLVRSLKEISEVVVDNEQDMTEAELAQIVRDLHDIAGIDTILVTLGAKGSYYSTQSQSRGLIPGVKVDNVVDTTAAGDTFVGYIATSLARSMAKEKTTWDVTRAVIAANKAAARCVQKSGAMQSIPYGYE